jgi:hypothetical protein
MDLSVREVLARITTVADMVKTLLQRDWLPLVTADHHGPSAAPQPQGAKPSWSHSRKWPLFA